MSKFGMYIKFTTKEDQLESLIQNLLHASQILKTVEGCEQFLINISSEEPNVVWVTEVWKSKEDQQAALVLDECREYIQQSMPLISKVETIKLQPIGGKGI